MARPTGTLSDGTSIAELAKMEERQIAARVYWDPEIFELELEHIVDRVWVFVAHESEIPNTGDFVARYIGRDPVIVTRGGDDGIRVLLNVCRQRAAPVCNVERGTATTFTCPYHGWIYRNTGGLLGVPHERPMLGRPLDRSLFALHRVRVDTYQGLVFATWNPHAPPLREYLGDMIVPLRSGLRPHRALDGGRGGPQRWRVRANWKLAADNFSVDSVHTQSVHRFAWDMGLLPKAGAEDFQAMTLVTEPRFGHTFATLKIPSLGCASPIRCTQRSGSGWWTKPSSSTTTSTKPGSPASPPTCAIGCPY